MAMATRVRMCEQPAQAAHAPNHTPTALHVLAILSHSHLPSTPHAEWLTMLLPIHMRTCSGTCQVSSPVFNLWQHQLCSSAACVESAAVGGLSAGALQACMTSRAAVGRAGEVEKPAYCGQ